MKQLIARLGEWYAKMLWNLHKAWFDFLCKAVEWNLPYCVKEAIGLLISEDETYTLYIVPDVYVCTVSPISVMYFCLFQFYGFYANVRHLACSVCRECVNDELQVCHAVLRNVYVSRKPVDIDVFDDDFFVD